MCFVRFVHPTPGIAKLNYPVAAVYSRRGGDYNSDRECAGLMLPADFENLSHGKSFEILLFV